MLLVPTTSNLSFFFAGCITQLNNSVIDTIKEKEMLGLRLE